MISRRSLMAAICAVLFVFTAVTTVSANVASAPGKAVTFAKGVTTIVTTWNEVIATAIETQTATAPGTCESQTLSWTEQRTRTTTRYYTRTVLHHGTANSNGKLISDVTVFEDVVTYSAWAQVGDVTVAGSCSNGNGHAGTGNSGVGQGGGGGNGTGNEGNGAGPGASNGNGNGNGNNGN